MKFEDYNKLKQLDRIEYLLLKDRLEYLLLKDRLDKRSEGSITAQFVFQMFIFLSMTLTMSLLIYIAFNSLVLFKIIPLLIYIYISGIIICMIIDIVGIYLQKKGRILLRKRFIK